MRPITLVLPLVVVAGLAVSSRDPARRSMPSDPGTAPFGARPRAAEFVPNLGQWHADVRYAVLGGTVGWLHDDGFSLRLERWAAGDDVTEHPGGRRCAGAIVRTRFEGAAAADFAVGEPLATRRNFFVGDDASRWRPDVPAFAAVTMHRVLPGIDVRFRPLPGDAGAPARGSFEYDLLLAPGADLERFVAQCEGAESLRIDADGSLRARVPTPDGAQELVQHAPVAWQETSAGPRPLQVAFRLLGSTRYGFVAADLDPTLPAVVDPGVIWGTYLGGGASERINGMRWQPGSGVWVAGWTGSTDFPATAGAFQTTGGADGFVAKLDDTGSTLQFATYLGGNSGEEVRGIAIGPGATPTVVGFTHSTNFPTTPSALQSVYRGASPFLDLGDGFVVRLNASGSALLAATYLGGAFDDILERVAVDALGNAVVAGWTSSADMPATPGTFQPALGGLPVVQSDGYVGRINASGTTLQWGTFLGGGAGEQLLGVAIDGPSNDVVVTGWSIGADYPTTPAALRPTSGGMIDAVVTRLNANGTAAVFSTYLGGIGEDAAATVRIAGNGTIWVGGFTSSTNYPTTPAAPQPTLGGQNDGFVSQLSANGQSLVFSTLLGGPGPDRVRDLAIAAPGILVVGECGDGFPVTPDAVQPTFGSGVLDAFATLLTNGGAVRAWSSYFGGLGQDALGAVALDDGGIAVVAGWSFSSDFPIAPAAYQSQLIGTQDGVVLQLDLLTDLGDGLQVESTEASDVEFISAGDGVELLGIRLRNVTARTLVLDGVRVFVGGAGVAPTRVQRLRAVFDDGVAAPIAAGGPVAPAAHAETEIPLQGVVLPAGSTALLHVLADISAAPDGSTIEVAAAVVAADAWHVSAPGAGAGPAVRVLGTGRVEGAVCVLGALPGDADGDRARTVVDLRRIVSSLGSVDQADADGDGMWTPADSTAVMGAVLGRGTVFSAPTQVARGGWLRLGCLLPRSASVQAVLGGRTLVLGRATPRELTLRVEANQPQGVQELVITHGGRVLFTGFVSVL